MAKVKTESVTANVTPALKRRIVKSAKSAGETVSAHLENMLAYTFYGRGVPKPKVAKRNLTIFDKPVPAHVRARQNRLKKKADAIGIAHNPAWL